MIPANDPTAELIDALTPEQAEEMGYGLFIIKGRRDSEGKVQVTKIEKVPAERAEEVRHRLEQRAKEREDRELERMERKHQDAEIERTSAMFGFLNGEGMKANVIQRI